MSKPVDFFFVATILLSCLKVTVATRGDDCKASYCPSDCSGGKLNIYLNCLNGFINPTTTTTKKITTTTKKTTKKTTTTTKKTTKKTTTTTTTKKTTTTTKATTKTTTPTTTVSPTKHVWNGTFIFEGAALSDKPCCVHIVYDNETANASSVLCGSTSSTRHSSTVTLPFTSATIPKDKIPETTVNARMFSTLSSNVTLLTTSTSNNIANNASTAHMKGTTTQYIAIPQGYSGSTLSPAENTTVVSLTSFKSTTSSQKLSTETVDGKTTHTPTSEMSSSVQPTLKTIGDTATTSRPFAVSTSTTVANSTSNSMETTKTTETTARIGILTTNASTSSVSTSSIASDMTIATTEQISDNSTTKPSENATKVNILTTNVSTSLKFTSTSAPNAATTTTEQTRTETPLQLTSETVPSLEKHTSTIQNLFSLTTQNDGMASTSTDAHNTTTSSATTSTLAPDATTSTEEIGMTSTPQSSPSASTLVTTLSTVQETPSDSTNATKSVTFSTTPNPTTTFAKSTDDMATSATIRDMETSTVHAKTTSLPDKHTPYFTPETSESITASSQTQNTSSTVIPKAQSSPKTSSTTTSEIITSTSDKPVTSPTFSSMFLSESMTTTNTGLKTAQSNPVTSTKIRSELMTTPSSIFTKVTTDNFQEKSSTSDTCICANSGTCNADGLCVCADGYFGAKCDQTSPSPGVAAAATAVAVVTAVSQSSSSSVKFLWPRYSASVRMPTNPHEFFRLMSTYFLTVALGVNSMFGVPKSSDVKHMPMCAMSYLFGTGAFFLSLTAMIFEAGVDALTLSGAKFNAWTRPAERRPRCFSFWPTMTLYVLVGVAPTAGLWLKHWTDCVTTRSCIGSLGYGDFNRSVKDAAWLQMTVTLFYLGLATVVGILAIACNRFDICRCRRRTEAWSINPYVYGREVWPLEANAYFWLVAIQPILFGVCWMSYMHVNDAKTVKAQWINLVLTTIYSFTSTVQSSLTTSQQLSNTVCSLMTMLPQRFLFLMPSTDHVSLKDKKGILKDQMHPENWQTFELKELNDGPVPAYPIRYDSIPFGLAQYMCRLWTTNYLKLRANGNTIDNALTTAAKHFLLQLPDLRTINTFEFAHLFSNWAAEVREKDSNSVSLAILQKSLRIMDRQMDLSVPPPMIVVKECGTDTEYRRKISHLTPMDGEDQVVASRKNSKHCDVSLDDTQPAFIGPKTEEHSVSALVPHELFVAFNMDDKNIDAN